MAKHWLNTTLRILLMALAGLALALFVMGIAHAALSAGPRLIVASMLLGGVYGWLQSTYSFPLSRRPRFDGVDDENRRVYVARRHCGPRSQVRRVPRRDIPIPESIRTRMSRT